MKNTLYLLLCGILLIWTSCNKDESSDSTSISGTTSTTVYGRIVDENGTPVSGATVTIGSAQAISNIWGIYLFENITVTATRAIVKANMNGYWEYIGTIRPLANSVTHADISLFGDNVTHTINSTSGGTITRPDGATIVFLADAFESANGTAYTGNVAITFHSLPRNASLFIQKSPGTDFKGKDQNGNETQLVSFGMIGAKIKDTNGQPLQLRAGKKATITLPIISQQQINAPSSIPLWHFDETTAIWQEEGTATRNGNNYTGEVSHFSWWNCDMPGGAMLNGRFLDCTGNPLPDVAVYYDGIYGAVTDINGWFSGMVQPNFPSILSGEYTDSTTTHISNSANIPGIASGATYTAPDLQFTQVGCQTRISGSTYTCNGTLSKSTVLLIHNNQLVSFQYTSTGSFSFFLPTSVSGSYTVVAYKDFNSATTTLNVSPGINNSTGNIALCASTNVLNNVKLTFTSTITGVLPISFEVNSSEVIQNGNQYETTVNYTDSATQTNGVFKLITSAYLPGNYNWNGTTNTISGTLSFAGINYSITPSAVSGFSTLNNTPAIGGNITGSFSGSVTLTSSGLPTLTGTLSGAFDMLRSQ